MKDEFYVGYAKSPPAGIRQFLWRLIPFLVVIYVTAAILLPHLHFDQFNLGVRTDRQEYVGFLKEQPTPHLLVPRPGDTSSNNPYSVYLLSGTGKTAPKPEVMEQVGSWVNLTGIPFSRNDLVVLATIGATPADDTGDLLAPPEPTESLGQFSLTGEIVDGKCYPGVMKPGRTKTHRACAIRCIAGGVPPVFVTHAETGETLYFLLADLEGKAVGDRILDVVADPLRITGEVVKYNGTFILKSDPSTYERVKA